MFYPRYALIMAGASLALFNRSAHAITATGTIIKIDGGKITVDVGESDGLSLNQVLTAIKNGESIGQLRITALRSDEADAVIIQTRANHIITLGDTVAYERNAVVESPSSSDTSRNTRNEAHPESQEQRPKETSVEKPKESSSPRNVKPVRTESTPSPAENVKRSSIDASSLIESTDDRIVESLTKAGFENVVAFNEPNGGIYAEYENRRFRWEIGALGVAMRAIADSTKAQGPLTIVGKERGIPVYQINTTLFDFRSFLAGRIDEREFGTLIAATWPAKNGRSGARPSYGKVDLTLGNGYRANITTYPGQSAPGVQSLIRIGAQTDLFKGFRAQFREWIPLNDAAYYTSNPSVATSEASYLAKISPRLYGLASVGVFSDDHAAVRGEGDYFPTKNDAISLQFGKTGARMDDLHTFAYLGTWRHQIPRSDAQIFGRGGKYLNGDHGGTVGLSTQFRERSFEFSYTKTNIDKLVMFTVGWPLGERAYAQPSALRLRTEDSVTVRITNKSSTIGQTFPEDGAIDNWQVAMLPANIHEYLAFLRSDESPSRLKLMKGVQANPSETLLGPSLTGSSGLWFAPAAEVEPYGYLSVGANWVSKNYRNGGVISGDGTMAQYVTIGALPRMEVTLRLTNLEGKLGAQRYDTHDPTNPASSGWDVDRMFSAQYLLWREKGLRPAFLVGAQDFLNDIGHISKSTQYKAYYGVMSKRFGSLGLHAGVGKDLLSGGFGGADYRLNNRVTLIGDATKNQTTLGLRVSAMKNIKADIYSPGLDTFGAGITYTRRM